MADEKIAVSIEVEDKFTSAFNRMSDSLKVIENNLSKVKDEADKKNATMKRLAETAKNVAMAYAGLSIIKTSIVDFQSAEMAQNKLNKAFENSKGGIGLTKKELEDLGKTLEDKTLFSGEAISDVQSKFIAFRNIGGDVFKRATELALDFSAATGQDASASATTFGKALSNPIEGLGALKKAGIDFNFEQEQMIEKMVRSGDIQSAQKFILKELEEGYKGQAVQQTKGAGAIAFMTKQFGQLSEEIGKVLFSYLQPFVSIINESIPFIKQYSTYIVELGLAVGGVALAFKAATIATTALNFSMSLLTKSNLIIAGITAGVFLAVQAFKNWDEITSFLEISFLKLNLVAGKVLQTINSYLPNFMSFSKEVDKSIDETKQKIDKLEAEKVAKRLAAEEKEKQDKKKADDDKLEQERKFQDMLKNLNDTNRKEKGSKLNKEREDEFQKKLKEYDNLSSEDIKFLREEDKRAKEQKTKDLKLKREAYNMLSKEDKDYLDEKARFEMVEDNKQFKKDQQLVKRKMKLTDQYGTQYANVIIAEEKRIADEKEENENRSFAITNNIGNARLQATKEIMANVSALMQAKNKEMFELGKAASIAQATINTWEGASKALAQGGIMGPIMAAAVVAAGMVQVSNISAQSFAEGGVVGGFMGATAGPDTTTVNARPGEMFLNAPQQRKLFDQINGISGTKENQPQVINNITNVKMYGNGDKTLKKMVEKTIELSEKRKQQKQQFVKGRFA